MSDPNTEPDDYERKFMTGKGKVRFRDRAMAPLSMLGVFAGVGLATIGSVLVVPDVAGIAVAFAVAGGVFMTGLGVSMMALRTLVSDDVVHIQYGLFGPTIPIENIERCTATTYNLLKVGGFGVRRSLDGATVYNMAGDGRRAAEIVYRDGNKSRRILVSVKNLDGFVAAVEAARHRKMGSALAAQRDALGVADAPARDVIGDVGGEVNDDANVVVEENADVDVVGRQR